MDNSQANYIRLDLNSKVPLYRQIRNRIVQMVDQGFLKNGDILYPERKLAALLRVSRGTVRKAYSELQNEGMIVSRQGGHYYVSGASKTAGRFNQKANLLFTAAIQELMEDGQFPDDIFSAFKYALLDVMKDDTQLHVAVIECRMDVKYIFDGFFEQYTDVKFSFFLLNELYGSSVAVSQLYTCDIILTTASHYFEVYKNFPVLADNLIEIVTLWSQQTVRQISAIPSGQRIGVIYSSPRTVHLVKSALKYFDIDQTHLDELNEHSIRLLEDFVLQHDVIIAEPPSTFFTRENLSALRKRFEKQGGVIIPFEHYIDSKSSQLIANAISTKKWKKLHKS